MKNCGDNIPIQATKIVSKSGEIPPKPPASLFLLLTAVKIMYGTKKCVIKSNVYSPQRNYLNFNSYSLSTRFPHHQDHLEMQPWDLQVYRRVPVLVVLLWSLN